MDIVNLIFLAVLIGLTGYFVATEFAIVKVRSSRIDQLISEGKKGAVSAKKVVSHMDEYLSACQLGITVTALGLGWIGEPTVESLLHPLFAHLNLGESISHVLSFGIAFASVTFLHVVIGELAPKTIAIQKAEQITLLFSGSLIWFYKIMYPFIWILNGSARLVTGMFGLKPVSEHEMAHSEEELRILLSESYKSGEINQTELKYMNNIFQFDERIAKEIMVPRTEMVSLSIDDSFSDVLNTIKREGYTRYPVIDGDKDHVIGIVNIKEIITSRISNGVIMDGGTSLAPYIKPVIRVIETVPIHDLLLRMQKDRAQLAILIDEYGGTSGLVTVEDILEEIVGEIRDEFDTDEVADIRKINEGHFILNAKVLIEDVNDLLGIHLTEEDIDTLGGWILTQKFDIKAGETIGAEHYEFTVKEMDGHQVISVEIKNKTAELISAV
ncbi:hemolysin family protein [Peribacillus kribbensis]|uniref:hemolysin family protein n=1 Tax=Peribacillus kribbensis TaxID=356658 RepID=UPI00040CDB51|nr:hemolysin family protein [Peribacillus kribbensis]